MSDWRNVDSNVIMRTGWRYIKIDFQFVWLRAALRMFMFPISSGGINCFSHGQQCLSSTELIRTVLFHWVSRATAIKFFSVDINLCWIQLQLSLVVVIFPLLWQMALWDIGFYGRSSFISHFLRHLKRSSQSSQIHFVFEYWFSSSFSFRRKPLNVLSLGSNFDTLLVVGLIKSSLGKEKRSRTLHKIISDPR